MKVWIALRNRRFLVGAVPVLLLLRAAAAEGAAGGDEVSVPGGPASVRRLFGLDPGRSNGTFFLDLNEFLLFGSPADASWSRVDARRRSAAFAEDVAEWHRLFGATARFAPDPGAGWSRCDRALEWLGFRVQRDGHSFSTERRLDETSKRRQSFLDALGTPTASFLGQLRAGAGVTVTSVDETAPLPFGLAAWRETVSEPELNAANVFLFFVKNVRASRMLVALQGLDPETREQLRTLLRDREGRPAGWNILYADALDSFSRFPEALLIREGRIQMPGGAPAEPIWTDLLQASPADPAAFLRALYNKDAGKVAYVVDVLQHLPESDVRELLLGPSSSDAVTRFHRLYASIDAAGADYDLTHRDPFDFAHVAPFLKLAREGWLAPVMASSDDEFPRNEAELSRILARGPDSTASPEESMTGLTRSGAGREDRRRARRRFVSLASLLAERPSLADPGLVVLLSRGFDRLSPAYSILEDLPLARPELARRYLFTLDRLERQASSRPGEVRAGLFQGAVVLLAQLARSGSLAPTRAETLFEALLALPLFAKEDVAPGDGEAGLFVWLADGLFPALRAGRSGEAADADELLQRALVGPPAPAPVEWRGGRYRFDPAEDAFSRRRAFRESQRLTGISDLERLHRERDEALAAAARGDLEAARTAFAELASGLRLAAEDGPAGGDAPDERVVKEERRARDAAAEIAASASTKDLSKISERLAALDLVLAERHLDALLGHVYAASIEDPNDLYYQDPLFVRRHSFRTVAPGGVAVQTAFSRTVLIRESGGGSRVAGSLFDVTEVLGLLHADQLAYRAGARVPSEAIRSGLVAPIWRMSAARLDDDSLQVVAASCRATSELANALAAASPAERFAVWNAIARDLVPRSRLAVLASREGAIGEEAISAVLSPSDLYRIGRRLARQAPAGNLPPIPSALEARRALDRMAERHGEKESQQRLAEFGPLAAAYAGRSRLTDMEMPSYERLAAYRRPEILSDRLYDLKIAVACRVAEAQLPAAVLPIVLPAALDEMLSDLKMAYAYDWNATTRAAFAFSRGDLERLLDEAVSSGRLVRENVPEAGS